MDVSQSANTSSYGDETHEEVDTISDLHEMDVTKGVNISSSLFDELGILADAPTNTRGRKANRRKSCMESVFSSVRPKGRPRKQTKRYSEECTSSSVDPLDEPIPQSDKRRKIVTNSKKFNSSNFMDSVIDQIANKVCLNN